MAVGQAHPAVLLGVLLMVVAAGALWPTRDLQLPVVRRSQGAPHSPGGAGRPRPGGGRLGGGRLGLGGAAGPAGSRWREAARLETRERALAELVAALAAPLRAGVPPAVAVAAAAPTLGGGDDALRPLLLDLSSTAARGAPVAEVWGRHARLQASPDLSFIGQAWALSELTGAPLADALACAEQVLRARARGRERLSAAAAGPRASMAVLCLLPASGPVVGTVMGVDPVTLYFASPVATGSLVLGVVLGLGAWGWSRRILRAAA